MDGTAIVLGVMGLIGTIVTGSFAVVVAKLNRAVGKPNGEGNVVQMNERIIHALGRLEQKLEDHIQDRWAHGHPWDPDLTGEAPRSPQDRSRGTGTHGWGFQPALRDSHTPFQGSGE